MHTSLQHHLYSAAELGLGFIAGITCLFVYACIFMTDIDLHWYIISGVMGMGYVLIGIWLTYHFSQMD